MRKFLTALLRLQRPLRLRQRLSPPEIKPIDPPPES